MKKVNFKQTTFSYNDTIPIGKSKLSNIPLRGWKIIFSKSGISFVHPALYTFSSGYRQIDFLPDFIIINNIIINECVLITYKSRSQNKILCATSNELWKQLNERN